MRESLRRLLDHLEESLDPARQQQIETLHQQALGWEPVPRLPLVISYPLPEDGPFQPYPHSQALADPEKMLHNELVHAFGTSIAYHDRVGDDLPYTIRANMGTVLIASLFGARVEQVDENPPWVRPLDTADVYRFILDRDAHDYAQGWCPRVVERYRFYRHTLGDYPKLSALVKLVLPDLQGPLDTAELLRGSEIYLDFYQQPELVGRALGAIAEAQVGFARYLGGLGLISDGPEGLVHQHATMIRGSILLRNDSAIMLSPRMYADHVAPHDAYVLREMGGGGVHSCGRFEHQMPGFLALADLQCIDLGQPEMNDLDAFYEAVRPRQVALIRIAAEERELRTGQVMARFPTGASLFFQAASLVQAAEIMADYRAATEG